MKIKRTVAADMRAAMQIIRDTHGPEAVILSKRTVAGGIEVVSAIDVDANDVPSAAAPAPRAARPERTSRGGTIAELESEITAATSADKADANRTVVRAAQLLESAKAARRAFASGLSAERSTTPNDTPSSADAEADVPSFEQRLAMARAEAAASSRAVGRSAETAPTTSAPVDAVSAEAPASDAVPTAPSVAAAPSATPAQTSEVHAELKRLRQLMSQQLAIMGWQAQVERSPASVALLRDLHALGFHAPLSQRVSQALSLQADPDTNWQLARHWLAARLPVSDCNPLSDPGVSAVFGGSGVGKTSTVVKIASQFALAEGTESVVLVSTDTERVGGNASLGAFANVLGMPVHTVNTLEELDPLLRDLRDRYARVLIDTGNGSRNRALALELADIAERAEIAMQHYLVMAANASAGSSLELLGALGRSLPVATILTKLDEARELGSVFSTVIEHQLPIAAVSAGSRIPDDIERVETEHLIQRCEQAPAAREAASSLSEPALVARYGGAQ
ncbi:MAG: flagellar biosynthesis protein FlhF [Pseudomonadota bacterium]